VFLILTDKIRLLLTEQSMKTQLDYLTTLGIESWQLNGIPKKEILPENSSWEKLREQVAACTTCALHKTRTQTVFGVGNFNAELMLIGEAPGFHEDKQGEPFVGRAGQLLNSMLQSVGFHREQVYIANILKCRPPENRDPQPDEVNCCTPFLQKQIALIQPKLLLAVGRIAAHYLLNTKQSLTRLRGQVYSFGENKTPLLVTFHPAYLLRNPADKGKAFQDLQHVFEMLQ